LGQAFDQDDSRNDRSAGEVAREKILIRAEGSNAHDSTVRQLHHPVEEEEGLSMREH
jgi:hypothetical protein